MNGAPTVWVGSHVWATRPPVLHKDVGMVYEGATGGPFALPISFAYLVRS